MIMIFLISKANLLKSARGRNLVHRRYMREKHSATSRTRKKSTKLYKAIGIKKGVNRDLLKGGFKETKL